MTESLWRDIELIKKKFSFRYVSKIGIPIIVAATGAGSTIYHFTGRNELFILTVLFSLVISTGLISVFRGRIGIEIVAFAVFFLIIIWLGANIVGIKLSDTLSSFVISFLAGATAASIVPLSSSLVKRLAAGKRK